MRWLHIYLSMFGLAAVLFFSVTGITLNHPDWAFGQVERRREAKGQVDLKWIGRGAADRSAIGGGPIHQPGRKTGSRRTPAQDARDPRRPRGISRR